jgi:hypothetical protein
MKHFPAFVALGLGLGLGLAVLTAAESGSAQTPDRPADPPRAAALLLDIHREVKEMGPYPGEDFVRREFFLGEDDDDTNKDIHAVIIIQASEDGSEKMRIQVTIMERSANDPKIKYARGTKNIVCRVSPAGAAVLISDYTARELEPVLRDLKRGILDKKRLLKSR